MRVQLAQRTVEVTPGVPVDISLEVFNAEAYIDGVSARVIGLAPEWVECDPWQLSLFPETTGTLRVRIAIPPSFPAGEHLVAVEVRSTVDASQSELFDVVLLVPEESAGELSLDPPEITGGTKARFDVFCTNAGNVPLDLALTAHNPEAALRFRFEPSFLAVPVGGEARVTLFVEGPRPRFGQLVTRPFTVEATDVDHELTTQGAFHQRPRIPRGLITAGILAAIVGLWAAVFLFGMREVLDDAALTKAAPLSLQGAVRDPNLAAVSASVKGRVTAATTEQGLPRVTVEALRRTRNGIELEASAATDEEGGYELGRLRPGTYTFRFTAPGFEDIWWPAATSPSSATARKLRPREDAERLNAVITGLPGSIAGRIEAGALDAPPPVRVTVRDGSAVDTDAQGNFSIAGLATPNTYELAFESPGFQPQVVSYELGGGQALVANTVRLSAGPGSISGTVSDGSKPLGGVKITAISGPTTIQTASPTTGQVGQYSLSNLPTPGTYLLTFEKVGFGTQSIALDLPAGESRTGVDVVMIGGTGTVSGQITNGGTGGGLGDVTVRVLGGPTSAETKTLTAAGQEGTYRIPGLPTPGTYTVTFSKEGFTTVTRSVTLEASGLATGINGVLLRATANVSGIIVDGSNEGDCSATISSPARIGASIGVTDGAVARTTISTATPTPGGFRLTAITPGIYTVTVTVAGRSPYVTVVALAAGDNDLGTIALCEAV